MIDSYLQMALKDLEHRLIKLKSGRPRNLPAEYDLASQAVSSGVDRLVEEEHLLQEEHENSNLSVGSVVHHLRNLTGETSRLETVLVPALANVGQRDIALTKLLRRMHVEIQFPLFCPAVTRNSQELFWIDSEFQLLGVPFEEDHSPLQYPVFYHELGHLLFAESNDQTIAKFLEALLQIGAEVTQHFKNCEIQDSRRRLSPVVVKRFAFWRMLWIEYWIEEMCCDAFAAAVCGPAYMWAFVHSSILFGNNFYEMPSDAGASEHPADSARVEIISIVGRVCGWGNQANQALEIWDQAKRGLECSETTEFRQCYPNRLLSLVASKVVDATSSIGCSLFEQIEHDSIRSELLEYWEKACKNDPVDEHLLDV